MDDQVIDESVRRPSLRFWFLLGSALLIVGAGLVWGYPFLFPDQAATLNLSALVDKPPVPETDSAPPTKPEPNRSQPAQPSSSLVTTKDTTSGFQVAHPAQWTVQSQDGFVLLTSDDCGTSSVIFYPIQLLGKTQEPTDLLSVLTTAFAEQLKDGTQGLQLGSIGPQDDGGVTALLSGSVCGSEVTGIAQLTVQGNRALFKFAWYPVAHKEQLTNTVAQILRSYKSVVSTATFGYQGSAFQLPVPDGWLFEESEGSASVHSGDRLLSLAAIDFSADQPLDTALDTWLSQEKEAGRSIDDLAAASTDGQSGDDQAGHRYNTKTRFVTYAKDGTPFRGALTAAYTDALGNSALILWRSAPKEQWALAEPTLLLLEQGATYQRDPASPTLRVPVYATWRAGSPLTGTGIRTSLNSAANQRWQPLIGSPVILADAAGARFIAPLTALDPTTGTYRAAKDGKPTALQPAKTE